MRQFLLLSIGLVAGMAASAQTIFSVGSTTAMTVKSGTLFSADSLVLTPGSDLTLSSNNLQISHTALTLVPAPSITRVYTFASQINFTGTIQLYYQPSELNGNPEPALKYTDSATGSFWLAQSASTVNTTNHYVQYTAAARNFIGATASHQGTVLALSLVAFTGVWQGSDADLSWMIDQTGEVAEFTVERSIDGTSWTAVGDVPGLNGDGIRTYGYDDVNPPVGQLMYRLQIHRAAGSVLYSSVVKLQRNTDEGMRLVSLNHSVIAYFEGSVQPEAVRVVNSAGALIRIDRTSRWRYEFDGLPTGVYYLQYEINGKPATKSFLVN
jgi:hypothetical protein